MSLFQSEKNSAVVGRPINEHGQAGCQRRESILFAKTDRLPERRSGDLATYRLYHHYYEDLLI